MATYNYYGSYSIGKNAKSGRARLEVTTSETATTFTVTLKGIAERKSGYTLKYGYNSYLYAGGALKKSASESSASNSYPRTLTTWSYTYTKGTSATSLAVSHKLSSKWTDTTYTSTASGTITIPAKTSYAVTYNANKPSAATSEVSGMPSNQTKYHDTTLTLSSAVPTLDGYAFKGWNTKADGTGTDYSAGGSYTSNAAVTLYAKWNADTPPTFTGQPLSFDSGYKRGDNGIAGLTTVTCGATDVTVLTGRTVDNVALYRNGVLVGSPLTSEPYTFTDTPATAGTYTYDIVVTDSTLLTASKNVGTLTVVDPSWTGTFDVGEAPPKILADSQAVIDQLEVWNYQLNDWETLNTKVYVESFTDTDWSFSFTFDANHVHTASPDSMDSPAYKLKITYKHYDAEEKEYRKAFFSTTRNQNFSNGIYNVMFVSGVSPEEHPNFSSRVWWSAVNDPLYFPDTNYAEVGSNDTSIMGLTKVGSYLGAIKQSKTTDTAIYLLYPTSFEEETTYAVKQGVQGIGALARYSFNILGDETLFLSPNGVMAIVPSDDEEHKVQNRSYFLDGRLLKETGLEGAYSFVYDGKYWLAVNGKAYVLDGNQRNSWGNDKTVLVYEGYYLENIPAKCFVKFGDRLAFTDGDNICAFNDTYIDAYNGEEQDAPVSAEWSTIFDDDNALHYYKTMQKKGNLVSILPMDFSYVIASIDEATFNANKKLYFTQDADGNYIQCTDASVYDAGTTYFIRGKSNTKVLVRKDGNEPVEIQREFNDSSNIPSEMFLKKKFKKYKRLQFIVRNDEPEIFGVDSIIKNYTIGNYAKK